MIDSTIIHSDGSIEEDREQGVFYTGESIETSFVHADTPAEKDDENDDENDDKNDDENDDKNDDENDEDDETVGDVLDTMTDKQKLVMYAILEEAIEKKTTSA